MLVNIRKGVRGDLPVILELVQGLAEFEKNPEAVTATLEDYQRAFDEGLIGFHIAEVESKLVGMSLHYMTFSTWKGHMLYLEDFFVLDEYRSHGIGQKLFDAFIEKARAMKCKMVKWEVLAWNKEAIKFYERNGATIEQGWYNGKIIFDQH